MPLQSFHIHDSHCDHISTISRSVHINLCTLCTRSIRNITACKIFTSTDVGVALASSVLLSHGSNTIELASVTGVCTFGHVDHIMHTAYVQQDSEIHLGHQSHLALAYLDHL